jgi:glycosyltransferase involved in cell wall biosynthesis
LATLGARFRHRPAILVRPVGFWWSDLVTGGGAALVKVAMTMEPLWHRVPGGTGRYTAQLAAALQQRADTTVVGLSALHLGVPAPPWDSPVPVIRLGLPRPALYEVWTRGSGASPDSRLDGADVLHATSVIAPPTSLPLVVTVHDLAFRDPRAGFGRRSGRLLERAWRSVLRRADAVISPSKATAGELRGAGLDAERLHVVPEGVCPLAVSDDDRIRVRETYGLRRPFVLSVCTLEPRKNLAGVLAAFSKVATRCDVDLVLAGQRGWGTPLSQLSVNSGVPQERVRALGFVPDADLHALYAESSVFLYPSWSEGFGLPVLEAMAQGASVVTSRGTATEEVCGDAGITVDPDNRGRLVAAVVWLVEHPAERAELGEAARRRAGLYTWANAAARTREVYAEVARRR